MAEEEGTMDYALSLEEMVAGLNAMGDILVDLDDEFRFFWDYFDFPDSDAGDYTGNGEAGESGYYTGEGNDGCIVLEEFETGLESMTSVDEATIISYWINYYWETYQINEYYWWLYHTRNGGFDWDSYRDRVPDGPAFDGQRFYYQIGENDPTVAFIWYDSGLCYFSLEYWNNEDPAMSGTCTIPGHKSIGVDYDYSTL